VLLLVASYFACAAQSYASSVERLSITELTEQHAKEVAEQAAAKEAAEREAAAKAKEAAEQKVKEEHEQWERQQQQGQAEEAKHRQEASQRQPESQAVAKMCVVPSLKGDSLGGALKAVRRADCRLGKVTRPHRAHGRLVVTGQSVKSGSKRPAGTVIAVTLGAAKRTH
jgi:FtsZ-interacting cell division protein ZipA